MPFDRNGVKLAILRELQREGQIYFVHNRVGNITEMADEIQQLVPDARRSSSGTARWAKARWKTR